MDDRLIKYFLGELNDTERLQLLKEISNNDSLKKEFISLQNVFSLSDVIKQKGDEEKAQESFQQFVKQIHIKKHKEIFKTISKIAAIAMILIASSVFVTLYFVKNDISTIKNTLYVPAGQRAQLTLQDGTNVWLNAQSTLIYPSHFSNKERKVILKGEAYFNVAKNPRKPFIVETQNVQLKVLGTQFNVYNYPDADYSQIALIEGSIKIYQHHKESEGIILKPNEEATIRNGKFTVAKIDNPNYFLWKDGIYCFENERLIDIIKKLQLYYDVTIKVEDPEIFNVRYTGKFRQRDGINEILHIIRKIHHFNILVDENNNVITITK